MANEKLISLEGHPLVDAQSIHSLDTTTSENGKVTVVKDGDAASEVDIYTSTKVDELIKPFKYDYLNVKDFGAKGDGQTNDTAAMKLATEASIKQHKSLYFPTGTYIGTVDYALDSYFTAQKPCSDAQRDLYIDIFGDGKSTVIRPVAGAPAIRFKGCSFTDIATKTRNIRNFRIHDMDVRSASDSARGSAGIEVFDAQNVEFSNVSIQYCTTALDLSGAMDFNIVNVDIRDCGTGVSMTDAKSAASNTTRSCNAVKFTNLRVENCPKLVLLNNNSYAVTFDNFKMETGREATSSPVELRSCKEINFSNGHMVWSCGHDNYDKDNQDAQLSLVGKVNDSLPFIRIISYGPSEVTERSTGLYVNFVNTTLCCPITWVGRMVDAYRTRFLGCTFNGLDCSGSTAAIVLRGKCDISDCTMYDVYKGTRTTPNLISYTATDTLSRIRTKDTPVKSSNEDFVSVGATTGDIDTVNTKILNASSGTAEKIALKAGSTNNMNDIVFYGKDGSRVGLIRSDTGTANLNQIYISSANGATAGNSLKCIFNKSTGTSTIEAPTVDVATNSTVVATTGFVHNTFNWYTNDVLQVKSSNIVKGAADNDPMSGAGIFFSDKNATDEHEKSKRLGGVGASYLNADTLQARIYVANNVADDTGYAGEIAVRSKSDGTVYTYAPSPTASSNGTEIATTKWVRDTVVTGFANDTGTLASLPDSAVTNVASFTLTKGVWLVEALVDFKPSGTKARMIGIGTSATELNLGRMQKAWMQGSGTENNTVRLMTMVNVASDGTYYLNAKQASGATMTSVNWGYNILKLK